MLLAPNFVGLEALAERGDQLVPRVPPDRKPRARVRAVGVEGRDDQRCPWSERAPERAEIATAIRVVDEEVEDGTVVPEREATVGLPLEDVRLDTPHGRVSGKASSGCLERRFRQVEHRHVAEPPTHELACE